MSFSDLADNFDRHNPRHPGRASVKPLLAGSKKIREFLGSHQLLERCVPRPLHRPLWSVGKWDRAYGFWWLTKYEPVFPLLTIRFDTCDGREMRYLRFWLGSIGRYVFDLWQHPTRDAK